MHLRMSFLFCNFAAQNLRIVPGTEENKLMRYEKVHLTHRGGMARAMVGGNCFR
jgi:hypothetical protein